MTRRTPAQYKWNTLGFDETFLTKHFSPLNGRGIQFVVAHHMTVKGTGTGSALAACYQIWQTRAASAHYGVDGVRVGHFVRDKDFAWATGSNYGNLHGISIEHANSTTGPGWKISEDTWRTGAKLAAYLHKIHKLGRPISGKTLRKHKSFTSTACPGPYMDAIWARYVAEAQHVYDRITAPAASAVTVAPAATPWFDIEGWNLGGMNATGLARWDGTEQAKVNDISEVNADIVCVQELPGPKVKSFSARMLKADYVRVCGSDGRYIFRKTAVREGASGVFNLTPIYANDNKQAAWAELYPGGPNSIFITNGHLEFREGAEADSVRVKQALNQLTQGRAKAKSLGITLTRQFFVADTNSEGMVRDALKAADCIDMFARAGIRQNATTATFTGWNTSPFVGKRIDFIGTHTSRPVVNAGVRRKNSGLSDHLASVCVVGKF